MRYIVTAAMLLAFTVGLLGALFATTAQPASAATPGQEWHACHMAVQVHEHRLQGAPIPWAAYLTAWRAADHADSGLRAGIHRYLKTDRDWPAVWTDCNPDA